MASKFSVKPAEVTRWSTLPWSARISLRQDLTDSGSETSEKWDVTLGLL